MKRYYIIPLAALAASCANDDILVNGGTGEITGPAITFGSSNVSGQTRGSLTGSDAATKLNNEFVVFGVKNAVDNTSTEQYPFKNTVVKYTSASAGSTESNTNNWEYVGETPYKNTLVGPSIWESADTKQTVKYWDYSATNGYTFTAFAGSEFLKNATEGTVTEPVVNRTNNGYTVKVPAAASLKDIFFSDRVTVSKEKYGQPVVLTFRNFGAKIRVGFYETVPGYSVSIDKFYYDEDASAVVTNFNSMTTASTNNAFVAALQNVNPGTNGGNTVNVSYYDANSANANQVKVNSGSTSSYQYTLTLGSNIPGKTLGINATNAVWDKDNKDYTYVYSNIDNQNPMLIRCDYTLTADDNSGETIKVKNARVTVPTQYVQWKSNYAYTYLFKISNNTNGTTGTYDPEHPDQADKEGLYPITFDAVVMEATDYTQETVTTVATNSVTSYAKDGYSVGKDIYFVNAKTTDNNAVITVEGTTKETAKNAVVYSLGNSTAISEGEILAKLTGSKIAGLTLSDVTSSVSVGQYVPSADGTNLDFGAKGALKFTPNAAGNYAYVYCTTAYVAPTYVAAGDTYEDGTTYYYNTSTTPADGVYYVASGITSSNYETYKGKLYKVGKDNDGNLQSGTAGVYDVKVITVVQ